MGAPELMDVPLIAAVVALIASSGAVVIAAVHEKRARKRRALAAIDAGIAAANGVALHLASRHRSSEAQGAAASREGGSQSCRS